MKRSKILSIIFTGLLLAIFAGIVSAGNDPTDAPTAVSLRYFIAFGSANGVELKWETSTEFETAGFRVQRSDNGEDGDFTDLANIGFVPAEGGSFGAIYERTDDTAVLGQIYWYKLQEVETNGTISDLLIVEVTAGATPTPTPFVLATPTTGSPPTSIPTSTSAPTNTPTPTSSATATENAGNTTISTTTPTPTPSPRATSTTTNATRPPTSTPRPTNTLAPNEPTPTNPPVLPTQTRPTTTASPIPIGSNPTATPFQFPTAGLPNTTVVPTPNVGQGDGEQPTPPPNSGGGGGGGGAEAAGNPPAYPPPSQVESDDNSNPPAGTTTDLSAYPATGAGTPAPFGQPPSIQNTPTGGQNIADTVNGGGDSSALPSLDGNQTNEGESSNSNWLLWGAFCAGLLAFLAGIFATLRIYTRRT